MKIKITLKEEINAYIYETSSRGDMGKSGIAGNLQVLEGDTYTVDPKVGFLIIFWNDKNTLGNFTFDYWIEGNKLSEVDQALDKIKEELEDIERDLFKALREMNSTETLIFHILVLVLAGVFVFWCGCCICCKYKLRQLENSNKN
jgi:hypothetical protein